MADRKLVKFIRESRARGFDDFEIKKPLINKGWPLEMIEEAFASLRPKISFKNKVTLHLDSAVLEVLDKRAKKNMMTLPEQIEDILRRSVVNAKKTSAFKGEKLDDSLIGIFSRRQRKSLKGNRSS